jgi:quaternary ammonium compound-resistance protein SugE
VAWWVLGLSGVLEAVWAVALAASDGLRRWRPAIVVIAALVTSLAGLAYAMTELPTGLSYAIWVGIGATLTAVWAFVSGQQRPTAAQTALLGMLVVCIAGLKVVS